MTTDRRATLKAAVADHIARDQGCSMREAEDMADYIVTLIRAAVLEEAARVVRGMPSPSSEWMADELLRALGGFANPVPAAICPMKEKP